MPLEIERRAVATELRAVEDSATRKKKMVGYAARYGSMSEDLGGFREIILPGAFDRALSEGHDVRALWNHNSDMVLGRTKAGTLRLSVDAQGLKMETDVPDTQAGRDALVSIDRGDVDQMSFGFRTVADNWKTVEGQLVRELIDLELLDVSPVAYPAYQETQVSARAIDKAKESKPRPPAPGFRAAFRKLTKEQRQKSFEDTMAMIYEALTELLGPACGWTDGDGYDEEWCIEATFGDRVIVETDYVLWSYPMTFDVDGKPTFGEPTKVEEQYVPVVDPGAASAASGEMRADGVSLETARLREQLVARTL